LRCDSRLLVQGNPPENAKTREKCGFSSVFKEGAVTLHQELGGISGAPAVKRLDFKKPDLTGGR
jgi:hypothetical protein